MPGILSRKKHLMRWQMQWLAFLMRHAFIRKAIRKGSDRVSVVNGLLWGDIKLAEAME